MTQQEARKLVAEFSRLRLYDALTREATAGLVATLAAVAPTVEVGQQIVEEIIAHQDQVPTEHELRQAAYSVRHLEHWKPDGKPDCEHCDGTGWIIVERGGLSGADPCRCRNQPSEALGRDEGKSTRQAPTVGAPSRPARRQGQQRGNLERAGDLLPMVAGDRD